MTESEKLFEHLNNDEYEMLEHLLSEPAYLAVIDEPNAEGDTLLHVAARRDRDAVNLLLEAGASPGVKNQKDELPLYDAIFCTTSAESVLALAAASEQAVDFNKPLPGHIDPPLIEAVNAGNERAALNLWSCDVAFEPYFQDAIDRKDTAFLQNFIRIEDAISIFNAGDDPEMLKKRRHEAVRYFLNHGVAQEALEYFIETNAICCIEVCLGKGVGIESSEAVEATLAAMEGCHNSADMHHMLQGALEAKKANLLIEFSKFQRLIMGADPDELVSALEAIGIFSERPNPDFKIFQQRFVRMLAKHNADACFTACLRQGFFSQRYNLNNGMAFLDFYFALDDNPALLTQFVLHELRRDNCGQLLAVEPVDVGRLLVRWSVNQKSVELINHLSKLFWGRKASLLFQLLDDGSLISDPAFANALFEKSFLKDFYEHHQQVFPDDFQFKPATVMKKLIDAFTRSELDEATKLERLDMALDYFDLPFNPKNSFELLTGQYLNNAFYAKDTCLLAYWFDQMPAAFFVERGSLFLGDVMLEFETADAPVAQLLLEKGVGLESPTMLPQCVVNEPDCLPGHVARVQALGLTKGVDEFFTRIEQTLEPKDVRQYLTVTNFYLKGLSQDHPLRPRFEAAHKRLSSLFSLSGQLLFQVRAHRPDLFGGCRTPAAVARHLGRLLNKKPEGEPTRSEGAPASN